MISEKSPDAWLIEMLPALTATMRGGPESMAKFGKLFLGALWETYGKDKLGSGS